MKTYLIHITFAGDATPDQAAAYVAAYVKPKRGQLGGPTDIGGGLHVGMDLGYGRHPDRMRGSIDLADHARYIDAATDGDAYLAALAIAADHGVAPSDGFVLDISVRLAK